MQSEILNQGIMPHSRVVLSSRSRVYGVGTNSTTGVPDELVGTISSFGISSNRNIEAIRGIGMGDHIAELAPGNSDPVELSITKYAMSLANTFQEFGYTGGVDGFVRALKHHRYPVDIKHEMLISKVANKDRLTQKTRYGDTLQVDSGNLKQYPIPGGGASQGGFKLADDLSQFKAIVTWFEGCWFSSYSITYPVESAAITEDSTLLVTDVSGHTMGEIILPYDDSFTKNPSRIWR